MVEFSPSSSSVHLLHQVGRLLDAEHVQWAAIGALAVAYHGVVRASLDADALITLKDSGTNLDVLVEQLRALCCRVDLRRGDAEDPLGFVVRIQDQSGNQVDLIGGIRRLEPDFFLRATVTEFDGMDLRIASVEDLIALKVFAGGPKDLEDASGILDVVGDGLDRELLLRLCRRFGSTEAEACEKLLRCGSD